MELTTKGYNEFIIIPLFMMSKIQNLNGTHNNPMLYALLCNVVYDVKDTKFEWNSQPMVSLWFPYDVVYDVKDTILSFKH